MKSKTIITLVVLGAVSASSYAYAENTNNLAQLDRDELQQIRRSGNRKGVDSRLEKLKSNRPEFTDEQKATIQGLRESGDKEALKGQLNEWGIEPPEKKGLRKDKVFENLSDNQKQVIEELRTSGAEKEEMQAQLEEFGIELPIKADRLELSDEQKQTIKDLKESGDREALKEYFEEIGIKKPRHNMQKRKNAIASLTQDEQEVVAEAREIARAGDKELAKEMLTEVFSEKQPDTDKKSNGIFRFFGRIFK